MDNREMIFQFLKYLQPTIYFNRLRTSGSSIFPVYEMLPEDVKSSLIEDNSFTSQTAKEYELSWRAIQKGYIGNVQTYNSFITLAIIDNYRFIRKYFHPVWVFYVLCLRLITFKNPIRELRAWFATRGTKRINIGISPIENTLDEKSARELLYHNPLISVVIPTLNRYDYLKNILTDFEKQDYKNFEIIVVDQSDNFKPEFYKVFNLNIKCIRQKEKALWLARNTAIENAQGEIIALSEDDVTIEPNWISEHLKCLARFDAQVSAGVFYPEGKSIPKERSFYSIASQLATGNAMLYKKVFAKIGLFDRQFEKQRMGDGEFGMRIYLAGIRSVSNPYAYCLDLKAAIGGLRELGSWDAFRPSSLLSPRPIPSVIYFFRSYFGKKATMYSLLRTVPLSLIPYQYKKNKVYLIFAGVLAIILLPLVLIQVMRSWYLASLKLKQGPQINTID